MELQHIEIDNLKPTKLNVRKIGAKSVDDLLPSIRSLGVLQPLLVRANCEGYEVIAGGRRYHASRLLADEASETGGTIEPLPCIIMQEGDDAKAIEASLAENIARLPMDEIDQYKAFAALTGQGLSIADVASQFGITELLVKKRLAIANLITPILTLYRKEEINADTLRILTLATKAQQKRWLELYKSEDDYAPEGRALKEWLFGGSEIPTENALFDITEYQGSIVTDLFAETQYFDDAPKFWELQNAAIASRRDDYLAAGWSGVHIDDVGQYFCEWHYQKVTKAKGGKVYISINRNGEVTFRTGLLTDNEAKKAAKAADKDEGNSCSDGASETADNTRPELTKAMQNYLDLHRHSAVRQELLNHQHTALCLLTAQLIAKGGLIQAYADPQKASNEAIEQSLNFNAWAEPFEAERNAVCKILGLEKRDNPTLVPRKEDWGVSHDVHSVFKTLLSLSQDDVLRVMTFVTAETLPVASPVTDGLGALLEVDMSKDWKTDEAFFDLLRDKEAINAMLKDIGGKVVADAHISSTAKVQKKIIRDYLDGTRKDGKENWCPPYISFPMATYSKREGVEAVSRWKAIKKQYA